MKPCLNVLIACCHLFLLAPWLAQAQATADLEAGATYRQLIDGTYGSTAQLLAELDSQPAIKAPSLFGGNYVLDTRFTVPPGEAGNWVIAVGNTVVEQLRFHLIAPDASIRTRQNGYWSSHRYLMHYGELMRLQPGQYRLLVEFSSPYFRSYPHFKLWKETDYLDHVALRSTVALGCLGTLLALALFNLFMFASVRDRSQLHYATYLLAYAAGWAAVFNLPASLTALQWPLGWNYLPFFLLPVFNTQFYLSFLKLDMHHPQLARWSRLNFVLPALLAPSCFIAPAWAHCLATITIAVWLVLALWSGIASMKNGYRPARYFVLAFCALIIPACLILPANLGLMPDLVDSELFTLLGGTLDALLLAFALADRLRLALQQKDLYLEQLNQALLLANIDSLTGAGSRYAFDAYLKNGFVYASEPSPNEHLLVLVDIDGVKVVNEREGYTTGDQLLRDFAETVYARLEGRAQVFRLGGDEFAIAACTADRDGIESLLAELRDGLITAHGDAMGVYAGFAHSHEAASAAILVTLADTRMYLAKSGKQKRQLRLA
ncbi:sensor domain-containing diguanylate cyclase [Viridibacterium curvum]|uniref:diguanylate cyclase n=1 Tax=Viridibacterium curvum TaxID=1101404 RepID=A0ABP9QKQ4_9RHOO